jgi:eukaryotic-like serine/threonine-protein kinase
MHELPQLNLLSSTSSPVGKVNLNLGSRYRALVLLAKGGMGAVYLAHQTGVEKLVAVKVMHAHIADSPETVNMFIDEARIGTRIDHPNVVRVLDTDVIEDTPFIVMEYIEGLSLSRFLRRLEDDEMAIEVDVVARVMHDALLGLGAAHDLEAIHRDVSPQNILIGADGRSRLTDFGVASFSGRLASTSPGEVRGKLGYLAPEQVSRAGVDQRADVFAAGIVLWETLTGKELFATNDKAETLVRVLREPVPPPSSVASVEIPPALEDACLRALERDRERRFQTAAEFATAIENAVPLASREHVGALIEKVGSDILANQRRACDAARAFLEREDPTLVPAAGPTPVSRPRLPTAEEVTTEMMLRPAAPAKEPSVVAAPQQRGSPITKWLLMGAAACALVGVGTLLGRSTRASSSSSSSSSSSAASTASSGPATSSSVAVVANPPTPTPTSTQTTAAAAAPISTTTSSSSSSSSPPPTTPRGFRRLPPRGHPTGSSPPATTTTAAPRGTRLPDGTFVPEQL